MKIFFKIIWSAGKKRLFLQRILKDEIYRKCCKTKLLDKLKVKMQDIHRVEE